MPNSHLHNVPFVNLQLSSMLPVAQENIDDQLDLQEALDAAGDGQLTFTRQSSNSPDMLSGPLGIPGIAALFNLQNGLSATSLNKKICQSLVSRLYRGFWWIKGMANSTISVWV